MPVKFTYDMANPWLKELKKKYKLDRIAGTGSTQERAINLLHWVSLNLRHSSMYDNRIESNSLALLNYAYKKPENGINCNALSVVLSEALLSIGIKARALWLIPESYADPDCHVVVISYIPEWEKWIMLDPTDNAYLTDAAKNILAPWEIRKKMLRGEEIYLNRDAVHNLKPPTENDKKSYFEYIAQNSFCYYSRKNSTFGYGRENETVYLCPKNFDIQKRDIDYLYARNENLRDYIDKNPDKLSEAKLKEAEEFFKKLFISAEELKKKEKAIFDTKYTYATFESF